MRARFRANKGLTGFAAHEALELLLSYAIPRQNTNPLAHRLLRHFGSLSGVLNAPTESLTQVPGVGEAAAVLLSLAPQIAKMAADERFGEKPVITNLGQAKAYCAHLFEAAAEEVLYVVCIDAQGRVLRAVPAIVGTIDEIAIYPRTVVSTALLHSAHSVLLAHNHPSGVREPSGADIQTTDLLRDALAAVDIGLLDHIIYADGECVSIARWRETQKNSPLRAAPSPAKAADSKRASKRAPSTMREAQDSPDTRKENDDESR